MRQIRTSVGAKTRQVSQRNPPKLPATAQCRKKDSPPVPVPAVCSRQQPNRGEQPAKEASILAASRSGSERRAWSLAFPDGRKTCLSIEELHVGAILFAFGHRKADLAQKANVGVKGGGRRLVAFLKPLARWVGWSEARDAICVACQDLHGLNRIGQRTEMHLNNPPFDAL